MGVTTFSHDFTSQIPAPRLFKALILDAHNLFPKITPLGIKSVDTIEGDGSISQINFAQDGEMKYVKHRVDVLDKENYDGEMKYVKHRVDVLDKENMVYAYTLIEGGEVSMDKIESISYEMKFESDPNGGCIGKKISKYHIKEGFEIKEEEFKEASEKAVGVFKAIEAFLLENPNAYV